MLGVGAVFACRWDRKRRKEIIAMSTLQGGMRRGEETHPARSGPCALALQRVVDIERLEYWLAWWCWC